MSAHEFTEGVSPMASSVPPPAAPSTFTIQPADDLGALAACFAVENLTLEQLHAWRDKYGEQGTHVILDDRDGEPACLHTIGDEHERCVCGRSTCPDAADTPPVGAQ